MFGCRLLRHADAGESAKEAVKRIGICLTFFGQEANATHLVSKRIGNSETCSRAKHPAAGIRHCHLDEPLIRSDITDATVSLGHETPEIQCTDRGRVLRSAGARKDDRLRTVTGKP